MYGNQLFDIDEVPKDLLDCFEEVETVCGSQWVRVVEKDRLTRPELPKDNPNYRPNTYDGAYSEIKGEMGKDARITISTTIGWKPTCAHNEEPIPAIVCDPFGGSGTTAAVAKQLGRVGICMDLSWEYLQLAKERCGKVEYQYSF